MLDFPTWFDRVLESLAEIPHPALHALIRSNHAAIREMAREVYDEKVRVARSDGRFDQAVRELRAAVAEARWQPSVDMLTAESTGGTYQATGPGFTTLTLRWDATRHAWFDVRRGPGTGFELTSGTGGIIEVLQAVTAWVREHPVRSGGVRTMADRAPEGKVLAFSPPAGAPPAAPIVTGINTAARQAGWTINHLGFDVPARKVSFDASRPDGRTLTMRGTFDRATLLSEAFPQYPHVEGRDISPLSRWSGTPDELFKVAAQYIADNPYQPAQIPAAPVRALAALPDVIEADVDALVDTSEPELEVVKNDRGILIRGNTRAHKDAIKALQFDGLVSWKWSGNLNAWYPRVRKGTDMDQVAVDLEVALNAQGIDTEVTDERTGEVPAPRPAREAREPRAPAPPVSVAREPSEAELRAFITPTAPGVEQLPVGVTPIEVGVATLEPGDYVWSWRGGYDPQDMRLEVFNGFKPELQHGRAWIARDVDLLSLTDTSGSPRGRRSLTTYAHAPISQMDATQLAVEADRRAERGWTLPNGGVLGIDRQKDGTYTMAHYIRDLPATGAKITGGRGGRSIGGALARFFAEVQGLTPPRRVFVYTGGRLYDITAPGQVYVPKTVKTDEPEPGDLLITREGSRFWFDGPDGAKAVSDVDDFGNRVIQVGGIGRNRVLREDQSERFPAPEATKGGIARWGSRLVARFDPRFATARAWYRDAASKPWVRVDTGLSPSDPPRAAAPRDPLALYPEIDPNKLEGLASGMQKQIDEKLNPAIGQLQATRRRADIAAGMMADGRRLQRVQEALRALAWGMRTGQLETGWFTLRRASTKKAVEHLLFQPMDAFRGDRFSEREVKWVLESGGNKSTLKQLKAAVGRYSDHAVWTPALAVKVSKVNDAGKRAADKVLTYFRMGFAPDGPVMQNLDRIYGPREPHAYGGHHDRPWFRHAAQASSDLDQLVTLYRQRHPELAQAQDHAERERAIEQMERELVGNKIPGFFPTPPAVVERMLELAEVRDGDHVLEPSAGNGYIADAARDRGAVVETFETSTALREILMAKGHELLGYDFMQAEPEARFDVVLMNPPFERGQDAAHIRRAWEWLGVGGRLVAVASNSVTFNSRAPYPAFREWLDEIGAEIEELPEGSFKASKIRGTGTRTILIHATK